MRPLRHIFRLWPIIPALLLAMLIAFTLIPGQLAPRPDSAPYPPACDVIDRNRAPSAENLLGTDYLGCDALSMIIYETRVMIIPLVISLAIGVLSGLYTGLIGGYFKGFVSKSILKLNNVWLIALIFLVLLVMSTLHSVLSAAIGIAFALFAVIGIVFILLATIAIIFLPLLSRIASASKISLGMLTLRTRSYIHRARRRGISTQYIILKRVVPRTSRVILAIGVTSGVFIIDPWVRTFLGLDYLPRWYTDSSDWFVVTSPITIIAMGVWVLSPIGTLILLAGWLQNRLPRF